MNTTFYSPNTLETQKRAEQENEIISAVLELLNKSDIPKSPDFSDSDFREYVVSKIGSLSDSSIENDNTIEKEIELLVFDYRLLGCDDIELGKILRSTLLKGIGNEIGTLTKILMMNQLLRYQQIMNQQIK